MDQMKIGAFLKTLRKEKGLTQEQLSEHFNVSSRTVSRWENGSNMPDLSLLVEIADFYDADIRELINGERKSGNMDNELKDTLKQAADYEEEGQNRRRKKLLVGTLIILILFIFALLLEVTDGFGFIPEAPCSYMQDFIYGTALAGLFMNTLYLSGLLEKCSRWKKRIFKKAAKR